MRRHDALSQDYDPGAAAAPEVSKTPAKNAPAKRSLSLPPRTRRPSVPMKKDGTVCILNVFLMHYSTNFWKPNKSAMIRAAGVKSRCNSCILAKRSRLKINTLIINY